MKTPISKLAAAALCALPLSVAACSGDGKVIRSGQAANVTVTGVNTSGVGELSLGVSDVSATVDGKETPVSGISGVLDLVNGGAQSVGRFSVPGNATAVSVIVTLDDYGAYESADGSAGSVDARGKVLSFSLPASALDGTIAASLDVGRSLTSGSGDRILEPNYTTAY